MEVVPCDHTVAIGSGLLYGVFLTLFIVGLVLKMLRHQYAPIWVGTRGFDVGHSIVTLGFAIAALTLFAVRGTSDDGSWVQCLTGLIMLLVGVVMLARALANDLEA